MHHDLLGEITTAGDQDQHDAVFTYENREIEITIIPDGESLDEVVEFAAKVVSQLAELDQTSKTIIVRDMRATYNGGWNEYDEAQEDGTFITVSNPELSETEFEAKFTLNGINITGLESIDLFYDDSNLF